MKKLMKLTTILLAALAIVFVFVSCTDNGGEKETVAQSDEEFTLPGDNIF